MPIDKTKMTKEMLKRAAMCQTADELIALAKGNGIDITKEEADSYLAELADYELDSKALDKGYADSLPVGAVRKYDALTR